MLRTPASMKILLVATPEAPTPLKTIFSSPGSFLTIFRALQQRRERHNRSAVLIVVKHRDIDLVLQPLLDLEASAVPQYPPG